MSKSKKKLIITLSVVLAVVLVLVSAFFIYTGIYYKATDAAQAFATTNGQNYTVEKQGKNIVFRPENALLGLVFYPGGKVEYTAYAPLMAELASRGVLCVLVKMPFNLAVFKTNAAKGIVDKFNCDIPWYIGGHSLGGAMAATYASKHASEFDGVLLLGAYSTSDLKKANMDVVSVYGTQDGVLNKKKYDKYKSNLPDNVYEFVLEGGCHSYFADYGMQKGDGSPTISRSQQLQQTADVFVSHVLSR